MPCYVVKAIVNIFPPRNIISAMPSRHQIRSIPSLHLPSNDRFVANRTETFQLRERRETTTQKELARNSRVLVLKFRIPVCAFPPSRTISRDIGRRSSTVANIRDGGVYLHAPRTHLTNVRKRHRLTFVVVVPSVHYVPLPLPLLPRRECSPSLSLFVPTIASFLLAPIPVSSPSTRRNS